MSDIKNAWDKINPSKEAKQRILDKIKEDMMQEQIDTREKQARSKRKFFRPLVSAATAAVLVAAVLVYTLMMPRTPESGTESGNSFFISAYALEPQEDGSAVLREVDILDQPISYSGHYDGERFFVSVGLRFGGENIQSVEFSVDEGYFATQQVEDTDMTIDGIPRSYVGTPGGEYRLLMYGTDFNVVGNTLTLEEHRDDLLIFWGSDTVEEWSWRQRSSVLPENIKIRAVATFNDGATAERMITIDLEGCLGSMRMPPMPEEDRLTIMARSEYYDSIPLEDLELIPESVSPARLDPEYNAYYWDVYNTGDSGDSAILSSVLIQEEHREFDENGYARGGMSGDMYGDGNGILYVIAYHRADDGTLTGMLYRVPEALMLPPAVFVAP